MPDFSIGVQLGLELTKVLGTEAVQKGAQSAWDTILALARTIRLTGSDLLVEEDLVDVLGRAKIEPKLEQRFRTEVLQATEVKVIQQGSVLGLSTGAGPTLTSSRNREGLMASVIQLSFLGWVHERISLASALDDCLNKRLEMQIPGANPSPGFNGIVNVLEVCSSQTSDFDWDLYLDPVRRRLQAASMIPARTPDNSVTLSASVLRACLDCLCIVQRAPEERFMIVSESDGLLTLIVWAHYLLNLSVLVIDRRGQNKTGFPTDCTDPSVIIEYNGDRPGKPFVSILDSSKDEIIRIEQGKEEAPSATEARERMKLRGYGTQLLCRHLNESLDLFLLEPDSAILVEGAQMTIAMTRLISQRLVRVSGSEQGLSDKCSVDRRRIYDAARIFFGHPFSTNATDRVRYEEAGAEAYLPMMLSAKSWDDIKLPATFQQQRYSYSDGNSRFSPNTFLDLAVTLLCAAAIVGIDECVDIKLALEDNFETKSDFASRISIMKGKIAFKSHDLLAHTSRLLVGRELALTASEEDSAGDGNCFMVSDFGWTISLPTCGDNEPFTVIRDSLYIRKGTPTNTRTMERKSRVHDALPPGIEIAGNTSRDTEWVRDRGKQTYEPRCASPVYDRIEYYGSRDNGFHLAIKFKGKHVECLNKQGEPGWFEVNQSCRGFFEGLWKTVTAPPCQHRQNSRSQEGADVARLGLGVATASGVWSWSTQENGKNGRPVAERVIVVLVKGDARARWLAIGNTVKFKQSRRTMLRGKDTCEDCAVKAAAALPGKWFVII